MQTCLCVVGWCSVLPGRSVLVLSSGCPPCRARVRGLAGQTLLSGINADQELVWSLLETCLPSVCVAAAYQKVCYSLAIYLKDI